jgi:hypothetical protein
MVDGQKETARDSNRGGGHVQQQPPEGAHGFAVLQGVDGLGTGCVNWHDEKV